MRITRTLCESIVASLLAALPLSAQQAGGDLSIVGGAATDVAGLTSRAVTVAPSLWFAPDRRLRLGLDANGTRFDNSSWSASGGASAAARIPLGAGIAATIDATGGATATSYDFSYKKLSGLPAVEASIGRFTAYAGVEAAAALIRSTRNISIPGGGLLGGPPTTSRSTESMSRFSRGTLAGANLRLPASDGASLLIGVREERVRVDSVPTIDRSIALSIEAGRVTVAGSLGSRSEPALRAGFGTGSMSVDVGAGTAVQVGVGRYPEDRLLGTPGGRFLNIGLTLTTGRQPRRVGPMPSSVPRPPSGMTRLALEAADASRVQVAGDFDNWKPIDATRAPNGVWYVDLRIPPGQYRYAFRVNGSTWTVPDGTPAVDDGFGGKSAWLTVSPSPSNPATRQ